MKPLLRPNTAPARMQIADTGLKSGMGANSMRPAAARAASTTVGMTCRKEGREVSKAAKNTPTAVSAVATVSSALWSRLR